MKLLLMSLVLVSLIYGKPFIWRTPQFDAIVQQIIQQQQKPIKPNITQVHQKTVNYTYAIKLLNRSSLIYFISRLLTYNMVRRSAIGSLSMLKENYFLKKLQITQMCFYKLVVVSIETLILKTIIKCALYISMHDAFDAVTDVIRRLFKTILSIN